MRYNPATDQAQTIDQIAAQCHAAINQPSLPVMRQSDDTFAAGLCKSWALCRDSAASRGDRVAVARLQNYLAADMHAVMHHRPHQPEF